MLTDKNKIKKQPIDIEPVREYYVMDESGKVFIKNFIIYEINMDYYLNLWYTKNEQELEKEKVLVMLGLDKNSLEELSENDKVVSRYMKEVNNVNKDPEFREYISYEEDQRKIQNTLLHKAEKEGIEQGKKSEKIEIAKGMLKDDIDIDFISKYTDLSKKEVEKLI